MKLRGKKGELAPDEFYVAVRRLAPRAMTVGKSPGFAFLLEETTKFALEVAGGAFFYGAGERDMAIDLLELALERAEGFRTTALDWLDRAKRGAPPPVDSKRPSA